MSARSTMIVIAALALVLGVVAIGPISTRAAGLLTSPRRDVLTLAIDPRKPASVYAGTGRGVFSSADGGLTWRRFSRGLTTLRVNDLVIAPTGRLLYAGTNGGAVFDYRFPG